MAKRKQPSRRPQAKHKKSGPSQLDKRGRLDQKNPQRTNSVQAKVPLVGPLLGLVSSMARVLDVRMAFRLSIIMAGMRYTRSRTMSVSTEGLNRQPWA